jgi:hypothetical protein
MINRKFFSFAVFASFFCFFNVQSIAQENTATAPDHTSNNTDGLSIADLQLKPIRLPALAEVGGSMFLTNDYVTGTIQLGSGGVVRNVPVKINVYSNAVMVQKEGQDMKLESFEMVSYNETTSSGAENLVIFRQGYPETDGHPATAVYKVLAYGPKLHLLKFLSQKVEDAPTLGDYSRRELTTSQQLYFYVPGGEMKKVKMGKQAIADAVPAFVAKADEIIKAKGLNLKNENDLVLLTEELNK